MELIEDPNGSMFWVIRDKFNNYVHEYSIRKIENDTIAYISYRTFGEECRGYTTQGRALKALEQLNNDKMKYGFDVEFHLEQVNRQYLMKEHLKFSGENMVIVDKKIHKNQIYINKSINNITPPVLV